MVFGYGYSHFLSRSDKQMNAEAIANGESDENKNRKKLFPHEIRMQKSNEGAKGAGESFCGK